MGFRLLDFCVQLKIDYHTCTYSMRLVVYYIRLTAEMEFVWSWNLCVMDNLWQYGQWSYIFIYDQLYTIHQPANNRLFYYTRTTYTVHTFPYKGQSQLKFWKHLPPTPYSCIAPTHSKNVFISLISNLIPFIIYRSFVCIILTQAQPSTINVHRSQRNGIEVCVCVHCSRCFLLFISHYTFFIFCFLIFRYSECWIIVVKVYLPSTVQAFS